MTLQIKCSPWRVLVSCMVATLVCTIGFAFSMVWLNRIQSPTRKIQAPHFIVNITGFGPFDGVKKNPTEALIEDLPAYLREHSGLLSPSIDVRSFKSFDVTRDSTERGMARLFEEMKAQISEDSDEHRTHIVNIHFGVSADAKEFQIARSAGNQFTSNKSPSLEEKIYPNEQAKPTLQTGIVVDKVVEDLQTKNLAGDDDHPLGGRPIYGWNVVPQEGAGMYMCNYAYYLSLQKSSQQKKCDSLFIHVPLKNDPGKLLTFAVDAIQAVCDSLVV
eukprot:195274_1